MRFGVSLLGLTQQPLGEDLGRRFAETIEWVHTAEALGFDYLVTGQHFLTAPLQQLQAVPVLSRLAGETDRLGLVATILAPLHNPVELAETLGTVDVLSGGRLGVCFALGYRDQEYAAFGVRRAERVARMTAVVDTVRALWSGEEVTSHQPWWTLDRARVTLRPAQRPHPPIWIAANADKAVVRAARNGLPWNINAHADYPTIARQVGLYRQAAAAAGHDGTRPLPLAREMYCAADRDTALEQAGPHLAGKYQAYAEWGQHRALPGTNDFTAPLAELASDRFIVGSPADCTAALRRYLDLGVDSVHLRLNWPGMPLPQAVESMRLIATEVLPALRRTAATSGCAAPAVVAAWKTTGDDRTINR